MDNLLPDFDTLIWFNGNNGSSPAPSSGTSVLTWSGSSTTPQARQQTVQQAFDLVSEEIERNLHHPVQQFAKDEFDPKHGLMVAVWTVGRKTLEKAYRMTLSNVLFGVVRQQMFGVFAGGHPNLRLMQWTKGKN